MKKFPDVEFEIDWLPFFLQSPSEPGSGEKIAEHLARKYGPAQSKRISGALQESAQEVGIYFNDERKSLNTLASHRLVEFAKRFHKQNEIIERVFEAYFSQARDINDLKVLTELAVAAGLPSDEVRRFLESDELAKEVIEEASALHRRFRVSGVPFFLISRPEASPITHGTAAATSQAKKGQVFKLNGAQDPSTFASIFEGILEED